MITKEQAVCGTKVKIPTQKTRGNVTHKEFLSDLADLGHSLPYLIITDNTGLPREVLLDVKQLPLRTSLCSNAFSPNDLDLYDPEALNPTSYPLDDHGLYTVGADPVASKPATGLGIQPTESVGEYMSRVRDESRASILAPNTKPTEDAVNPSHYNGKEVFNQMVAIYGAERVKSYCEINGFKYRMRAGKKDGNSAAQDIMKALWYEFEATQL